MEVMRYALPYTWPAAARVSQGLPGARPRAWAGGAPEARAHLQQVFGLRELLAAAAVGARGAVFLRENLRGRARRSASAAATAPPEPRARDT